MAYPTFTVEPVVRHLRETMAAVDWALDTISDEWTHQLPSYYPADSWTAARNLAHLICYEEEIGIPILTAMADGSTAEGKTFSMSEDRLNKAAVVMSAEPIAVLQPRLHAARKQSIALAESFTNEAFNARSAPLWNTSVHGTPPHSPGWVASKTFQHTFEHANAILRLALFSPVGD